MRRSFAPSRAPTRGTLVQVCAVLEALGECIIEAARVRKRHRDTLVQLTPTELTCMRFLGWGRVDGDIATLLMISENTVRVHLNNFCRKPELDGMR